MIGHKYERDFISIVSNNMIHKCPIPASDINNAYTMFGTKFSGTTGKKLKQNLDGVVIGYVYMLMNVLNGISL